MLLARVGGTLLRSELPVDKEKVADLLGVGPQVANVSVLQEKPPGTEKQEKCSENFMHANLTKVTQCSLNTLLNAVFNAHSMPYLMPYSMLT